MKIYAQVKYNNPTIDLTHDDFAGLAEDNSYRVVATIDGANQTWITTRSLDIYGRYIQYKNNPIYQTVYVSEVWESATATDGTGVTSKQIVLAVTYYNKVTITVNFEVVRTIVNSTFTDTETQVLDTITATVTGFQGEKLWH